MFKKLLLFSALLCVLCGQGFAQNLTTVSASNITDLNGTKLAAGQLCFLGTDQSDNPISFQIGGGGQALRRGYCSPVAAGVVTSFTVPNPASTLPAGVYYRVTVKDSSTGQEVLRYAGVTFTGATFNFDSYAPVTLGSFAPLSGNSVSGNLSVSGNIAATGTVTGSNIAAGQIATGTGTTNTLPKYTNGASAVIGNSSISDNGTTVSTTEALSVANVTLGTANTLSTNNIKQQSGAAFVIADPLGVSHLFISSSSPYQNTFIQGNGTGSIFLGSAAKTSVSDTTGVITMSGSTSGTTALQPSAVAGSTTATLPANTGTIAETNLAQTWSAAQTHNSGTLVLAGSSSGTTTVNASATASGTLTLPAATDTLVARATTDTLTNKTLTSPMIGTTTISEAPRMVLISGFQSGNIAVANVGSAATSKGVTIEAITVHSSSSSTCTVNPTIRVRNAGITVAGPTLTLTTGTSDWSTIGNAVNYSGSDVLFIEVTAAGTCTTPPSNIIVNVTGRMQ